MRNKESRSKSKGFSLIELLIVIALLAALSGIALVNFRVVSESAYDTTAESDYRNIKTAVQAVLIDPETPSRFVFRRRTGPSVFPSPLSMTGLSRDVYANIVYRIRTRNNRPPRIRIVIDVQHLSGTKRFRYVNVNGNVTEQVRSR